MHPLKFTLIGSQTKKHPVSSSSANGNTLLMRDVSRQRPGQFELTERPTVTQITTFYNCGEQKSISNMQDTSFLSPMGYSSKRECWVPLLFAKNRNLRRQQALAYQTWIVANRKIKAWSDESVSTKVCRWRGQNLASTLLIHGPNLPCVNSPGW